MDLKLNCTVAGGYKNPSQITMRLTEDWAARNMFCLSCDSCILNPEKNNRPVWDYACPVCEERYQLKGTKTAFGKSIANSAYNVKIQAINKGHAPHYMFLQYSPDTLKVTSLFVIPGHFLHPGAVRCRRPLSKSAKRKGWVGSIISLADLPGEARIHVVRDGSTIPASEARKQWERYKFLAGKRGGWAADVLSCIRKLQWDTGESIFTLQQFYAHFESELAKRHPENRYIRDKIRQQMQILRNGGVLEFLGRGQYRMEGWTMDVLSCIRKLQREPSGNSFTLQEFYDRFESELAQRHADNKHVRDKIRQQMQVLRDKGILEFLTKGRYRITS